MRDRVKLQLLFRELPPGQVLTTSWLNKKGYSNQLIHKYVESGWFEAVGRGAYLRTGEKLSSLAAVSALQTQLSKKVHIGAVAALNLQGYGHYALFQDELMLFSSGASKPALPSWFQQNIEGVYTTHHFNLFSNELGLKNIQNEQHDLKVSMPERAILEMLKLVPSEIDYQHAEAVALTLQLLNPKLMQALLEDCNSNKVRRLFLYIAETNKLPVFNNLNLKKLNLGRGKIVVGEGGCYSSKYNLSVPRVES